MNTNLLQESWSVADGVWQATCGPLCLVVAWESERWEVQVRLNGACVWSSTSLTNPDDLEIAKAVAEERARKELADDPSLATNPPVPPAYLLEAVRRLNNLSVLDPTAMRRFLLTRVSCSQGWADDPFVQVGVVDGGFDAGLCGVLNGALMTERFGLGYRICHGDSSEGIPLFTVLLMGKPR